MHTDTTLMHSLIRNAEMQSELYSALIHIVCGRAARKQKPI